MSDKICRTCNKRIDKTTEGPKCPVSGLLIKDWDRECSCKELIFDTNTQNVNQV
jgi:hypothetical protein